LSLDRDRRLQLSPGLATILGLEDPAAVTDRPAVERVREGDAVERDGPALLRCQVFPPSRVLTISPFPTIQPWSGSANVTSIRRSLPAPTSMRVQWAPRSAV
jgi:hypothetical protein